MKKDLHPSYYLEAVISCASCGTTFKTGATKEEIRVEICSKCHPFYTGKKVLIDAEGRADKFMKLSESATGPRSKDRKKKSLEERVNLEIAAQIEKEKAKAAKK